MSGTNTCGRRPPAVPNTNDSVPIIGADLVQANNVLTDAVHDTMSQGMNNLTRRNYRFAFPAVSYKLVAYF